MAEATQEDEFYEAVKFAAQATAENLRELLDRLEHAQNCNGDEFEGDGEPCDHVGDEEWHDEDGIRREIDEYPLSIQVREGWHSIGETTEPEEFEIMLGTGGPATRIVGKLEDNEPVSAHFEYHDWFKPWTAPVINSGVFLEFARQFWFGE